MTDATIKTKLVFALKLSGFNIHKIELVHNKNGSYSVGAILTNDKPFEMEEKAVVIKEDYRIRETEETAQRTSKE